MSSETDLKVDFNDCVQAETILREIKRFELRIADPDWKIRLRIIGKLIHGMLDKYPKHRYKCSGCGSIIESYYELGGERHQVIPSPVCDGSNSLYKIAPDEPVVAMRPVLLSIEHLFDTIVLITSHQYRDAQLNLVDWAEPIATEEVAAYGALHTKEQGYKREDIKAVMKILNGLIKEARKEKEKAEAPF